MEITKELFVDILEQMRLQDKHDTMSSKCIASMYKEIDEIYARYENHYIWDSLIKLLRIATNDYSIQDEDDRGWIDVFTLEFEFGNYPGARNATVDDGSKVDLSDAGKLWDYLSSR